jgi:type II restriction enzyme
MDMNRKHCNELSLDTGAFAGLLFEIGTQKLLLGNDEYLSEAERTRLEKLTEKRHKDKRVETEDEHLHNEMQYHLLKIGHSLGYDVIAASNDRSKSWNGNKFTFISLTDSPILNIDKEVLNTVKLIDVLWFKKGTANVVAAFEVEKSTSIYSGILRLTVLSCSVNNKNEVLYPVVPDHRGKDVIMQLSRPSIKKGDMQMKYICFNDLRQHCDALCKFGDDHSIMQKIARTVV